MRSSPKPSSGKGTGEGGKEGRERADANLYSVFSKGAQMSWAVTYLLT